MAEDITPNEGYLARFFQRDSDTLCTWGNTGLMMFAVFHEWGDSFDPASGSTGAIDGERYDAATDSFEPDCSAGTPVFNGRLSGLWDCVSQAWPDDLAAMYRAMRAAGFNADTMWEMYQGFRTQWCEALYAADAMGYANTGRFDMAYGDKSEAIRHFFRSRFRYLDSKYGANTSTPLEFRLWGNGKGVVLRYYCPLYASLNWGAGGIITERAITPGNPSYFPNPGTTFNETTFTVYNADLLTEICTYTELPDGSRVEGGLQNLATRCAITGLDKCRRLKRLEFDYSDREANTNLDGRVLEACRSVAMRRMVVRDCPNVTGHADFASLVIEEIDFRGTGVTGITVPETDTLTAIRLGDAVTELRLDHLAGLSTLTLDGTDALGVISVHDCPQLDLRPILYEALTGDTLREVSLSGVDWRNFGVQYLERLADIGADIAGTIAIPASANMSFALKQKCLAAWGDIDSADNPLFISYTKRPVEIIRISGAGYYGAAGDYQLRVVSDDPYANDFTKIEWSMTPNSYAEIDTLTGRVRVTRTGTEELAPTAEVTVTVTRTDGTTVSKTTTVGFYERACRLGDFVYADGSYSDIYDEGRTVVAVCCFIDPDDPTRRLGVAPRALKNTYAWGGTTALSLSDSPEYNNILVPGIPNVAMVWNDIPATEILDVDSGGFKSHSQTSIYRAGFITAGADVGAVNAGTVVPIGLLETAWIIVHRNKILRDSGINLPLPMKSETETELDCLARLISAANAVPGAGYKYYYPAASAAYAYEPTVKADEILNEQFKAHKWFLPAPGDLMRVGQAYKQGWLDNLKPYDFPSPSSYAMTSGQFETVGALRVHSRTGQLYQQISAGNSSKQYAATVFPMVQF